MVNDRFYNTFLKNTLLNCSNQIVYSGLSKINHKIYLDFINLLNLFIFLQINTFRFVRNSNLLVGFCKLHKLNWTDFSFKFYRFYTDNSFLTFNNYVDSAYSTQVGSFSDKLDGIISFKKKTSFFKKKNKLKNYLLFRSNHLHSNKLSLDYLSYVFKKNNENIFSFTPQFFNSSDYQLNSQEIDSDKILELKRKTFWIFYQNRLILKNFFFNCKLRQFQITKFFSKLTKKSGYSLFNFFENSLFNVLVRSKFVNSWKDSIFLIKNGYVFVNGNVSQNMFLTINLNDFVQICISDNYFSFFKQNFNNNIKFTSNMLNKVWQINRLRGNFYKQTTNNISSWIDELMFFYDDVPDHMEVDYTVLTLSIVYVNYNFINYNFFFTKFLNYFMLRHYNWKYIV